MRLVYLIYDYSDYNNMQELEGKIERLIAEDDGETIFFSPLHTFGWQYGYWDYAEGAELCDDIMGRCDHALVISGPFGTVPDEIAAAEQAGLTVDYDAEVQETFYI